MAGCGAVLHVDPASVGACLSGVGARRQIEESVSRRAR